MTRRTDRIVEIPWVVHRALREAWLTLVSPTWPRGYLRLLGAAGMVEGVFLLAMSVIAPVVGLAVASLMAGAVVLGMSFVPWRGRAPR